VAACACEKNRPAGPSAETVESARNVCQENSTHHASRELQMPQSSVWRILRKRLRVKGYRLQLLQALNPKDHNFRFHICVDFQQRLEEDSLLRSWFSVTRRRFMCVVRSQLTQFWQIPRERFLIPCPCHVSSRLPPSSETCKYATAPSTKKKLGEILYLLICSFLLCLSWLLRSQVQKSQRDL